MRLERLLTAIKDCGEDALPRLASGLGHAMPRRRPAQLRIFRSEVALLRSTQTSDYSRGYLDALLEVSAAFEREIALEVEADDAYEAVRRSPNLVTLIRALRTPATPTELASTLRRDKAQVSRELKQLCDHELAETLVVDGDGRMRPHRLTALGKAVSARLGQTITQDTREILFASVCALANVVQRRSQARMWTERLLTRRAIASHVDPDELFQVTMQIGSSLGLVAMTGNRIAGNTFEEELRTWLNRKAWSEIRREVLMPVLEDLPEGGQLWIRSRGPMFALWKLKVAEEMQHDTDPLASVRLVEDSDAHLFYDEPSQPYALLYDSLAGYHGDRKEPVWENAHSRAVLCSPGVTVPSDARPVFMAVS